MGVGDDNTIVKDSSALYRHFLLFRHLGYNALRKDAQGSRALSVSVVAPAVSVNLQQREPSRRTGRGTAR